MGEPSAASPEGAAHQAVTRSVTRSQQAVSRDESEAPDEAENKECIKNLKQRLNPRGGRAASKAGGNSGSGSNESHHDGGDDFCPAKFHGCSSSDAVQEIISSFGPKKLEILEKMGLGGLQHLKRGFHNSRHLVFWLLKRMDVRRMELKLVDGSRVRMTLESVGKILGIRCSGRKVMISGSKGGGYVKQRLGERFGTDSSKEYPDLEDLRKVLFRQYAEDMSEYDEETFMIAVAGVCCAYMFGPPRRTAGVPKDIWEFLAYPQKLLDCNWGGYVLYVLQSCARAVQLNMRSNPTSIKLGGCWLYLELLYMDNIDLGDNNIPLSWSPRIRWYDPKDLLEFTNHYEKCKGLKAKEAYLDRKRRSINEEDTRQMPPTQGASHSEPKLSEAECAGTSRGAEAYCQDEKLRQPRRLEELVGKINNGLRQVRSQLQSAANSAHAENKRMFEEQEQRLNDLYEDVDVVVSKLNDNLTTMIQEYVNTQHEDQTINIDEVNKCNRGAEKVSEEVKKEADAAVTGDKLHESGEAKMNKTSSIKVTEARQCKDKGGGAAGADGYRTEEKKGSFQSSGGIKTSAPCFDATPFPSGGRADIPGGLDSSPCTIPTRDMWPESGIKASKDDEPIYDATPAQSGMCAEKHNGSTDDTFGTTKNGALRADGITSKTNAGSMRNEKGESNPRMKKRKTSPDSSTPAKKRIITKTTTKRRRAAGCSQAAAAYGTDRFSMAVIEASTGGVTPIKRHVVQRQVPPSPFDLNLNPRTKCISVIEKRFKYFKEEDSDDLERIWFAHDRPWPIRLTGRDLWIAFAMEGPIGTSIVDAMIRLVQEEDTAMYKDAGCNERQWRHLLPACFSDFVMGIGPGVYSEQVKELFLGPHLETNAEHCRMIMLPANLCGHWTLYAWDLERARINVLDPVLGKESREAQSAVHGRLVKTLHGKLFDCIFDMFTGLEDNRNAYKIVFYNLAHRAAKKSDAAFYVTHYMKWFDGERLTFAINEHKAWNTRLCTLYNLLHMETNVGWKPKYM